MALHRSFVVCRNDAVRSYLDCLRSDCRYPPAGKDYSAIGAEVELLSSVSLQPFAFSVAVYWYQDVDERKPRTEDWGLVPDAYMKNIVIKIGDLEIVAKLNGSATAGRIWDALPIKSFTSLWGDEIYFQIPVKAQWEEGFTQETVKIGDVAYWPEGECFCIFFGATPISKPGEIRPASKVNVIGEIEGDIESLKSIKEDQSVVIKELAE